MAKVVVTIKIMPEGPEVDLNKIEDKIKGIIFSFSKNKETKTEIEVIGFGLKALKIMFVMDEDKGSPDPVTEDVVKLAGVNSAEIIDVRRALG